MLSQNRTVQVLVKALKIPYMLNAALGVAGMTRGIADSDLRYRVRYFDSFALARGIFHDNEYGCIRDDAPRVRTFIDLGCNVGYFPLLLSQMTKSRQIRGICIDANPAMVEETRRNLALNHLDGVTAIPGLVSAGSPGEMRTFWITQNSMSSTAHPEQLGTRFGAREVQVAVVNPLSLFREKVGDGPVDLLKIDIEGCELELLDEQPGLIDASSRIVLEYHRPKVTLQMIETRLGSAGFSLSFHEERPDQPWGIAYFARRESAS